MVKENERCVFTIQLSCAVANQHTHMPIKHADFGLNVLYYIFFGGENVYYNTSENWNSAGYIRTHRENNLSFEESNSEYVFGFGKIKISHKCSKISATKGNKTDFGCLNNGHMIHYLAVT